MMRSVKSQQRQRVAGGHAINMDGQSLNIYYARIVYKCADCFGDLKIKGAGLACESNPDHRLFIHRDKIAELQNKQSKNIESLKEVYQIIDGKVVIKDGN